jgi:diphosphomevalonate decarboxylase
MMHSFSKMVKLKVSAIAHSIQGLIKYHGLKDLNLRIPYHDSISVCVQALSTTTTIETTRKTGTLEITINGKMATGRERERVETVLHKLERQAGYYGGLRVVSENSLRIGKGLGFSASGFAALGLAAAKVLDLNLNPISLSETVRLGAGSSTRSLTGRFAIWYADKDGKSYSEPLRTSKKIDFSMVIVPIDSDTKTDEAHAEVIDSPLFGARCKTISNMIAEMKEAIEKGDTPAIAELAEKDTLSLHALTMTGETGMVLWEPDTIRIIKEVRDMRHDGIPAWYSIDTGPSVFINTKRKFVPFIIKRLKRIGFVNVVASGIGGKPILSGNHLF